MQEEKCWKDKLPSYILVYTWNDAVSGYVADVIGEGIRKERMGQEFGWEHSVSFWPKRWI
jgi:hypothetical protein